MRSSRNGLIASYNFNSGVAGGNNVGITSISPIAGETNLNATLINFALNGNISNWISPGAIQSGISCQQLYVFNGSGKWSDTVNWVNRSVPPTILPDSAEIVITPNSGECILNVIQFIPKSAKLTISTGKKFRVLRDVVDTNDVFNLTYEDIELLDSSSTINPQITEIVGADGNQLSRQGGSEKVLDAKKDLIDNLLREAQRLSELKNSASGDHPAGGANEPAHRGYAYSFGSKNFTNRNFPAQGDNLHRSYSVYGIDCSGFLSYLFTNAGLTVSSGTNGFEAALDTALKNHSTYKVLKLGIKDFLPQSELKSGDLIYWKNKGHIGIVANLSALPPIIYNSNGNPYPLKKQIDKMKKEHLSWTPAQLDSAQKAEQSKNWGPQRGIHPLAYTKTITSEYWGTNYEILRLVNSTDSLYIGQAYGGGKIFYLDETGEHGLVADTTDISSSANWYNAMGLCDNSTRNGYPDWFLPDAEQLLTMYFQALVIGNFSQNCAVQTSPDCTYWSSSEVVTSKKVVWHFGPTNLGSTQYPTYSCRVRAIRKF